MATKERAASRAKTDIEMNVGVVAGPLFLIVALVQVFAREGFDPSVHPLSLLSLGDLGWIQVVNFVVGGVLFVACAVGMRRALHPGRAGTWGPRLIGIFGISLIRWPVCG